METSKVKKLSVPLASKPRLLLIRSSTLRRESPAAPALNISKTQLSPTRPASPSAGREPCLPLLAPCPQCHQNLQAKSFKPSRQLENMGDVMLLKPEEAGSLLLKVHQQQLEDIGEEDWGSPALRVWLGPAVQSEDSYSRGPVV